MSSEALPVRETAPRHPGWRELGFSLKRLFRNPLTIIGLTIIVFFSFLAIAAPWLAPPPRPHDPYLMPHDGWTMDPSPPSAEHPLGTLPSQYDILYGVIWGTRNAFRIGLAVVAVNLLVGLLLGAIAGYFGGWIDEIVMRIGDVFYAIPTLVMAMALVIALGRGLQSIVLVLIILNWPTYTRMIRSEILVVRGMDYIQAGPGERGVPPAHPPAPRAAEFALLGDHRRIHERGHDDPGRRRLSFLGLGSDSGYADWGAMVSTCRNFIVGPPENRLAYWYLVFIPGVHDRPVRAGLEPPRRRGAGRVRSPHAQEVGRGKADRDA